MKFINSSSSSNTRRCHARRDLKNTLITINSLGRKVLHKFWNHFDTNQKEKIIFIFSIFLRIGYLNKTEIKLRNLWFIKNVLCLSLWRINQDQRVIYESLEKQRFRSHVEIDKMRDVKSSSTAKNI